MYFVEGRNIFSSIAVIVDRILGEYLRRPANIEPFFTSFCDGKTALCSGLSQWGTVTLANQGLTPMEILHYYYPSDLIIDTAPVATIVESFPGVPLSQGAQSSDVELMQRYLNRIRQNYPLIPYVNPNGIYGPETANAVRTFQQIFSLPQTGIIDRATWNKISYLFVSVTKLAELNSEGNTIVTSTIPPNIVIRLGSSGSLVNRLQFMLNYIGLFYDEIPEVSQDGVFGSVTQNAVIAFQNRFGLTADGIVGPATWSKLYEVYFESKEYVPETEPPVTPPTAPVFPGTALRVGSTGESVALMQQYLNALSTVFPSIPPVTADGIFGSLTETAVKAFQQLFGLTVDGIIGANTWNEIVRQYNLLQTTPPTYITHTVQAGDTLWNLAQRFGTTVDAIRALNNLTSDALQIGQVLRIPSSETTPPYTTHVVQSGDSLWSLAQQFGTTVDAIRALNNLTSDALQIGQILRIPTSTPTPPYTTHIVQSGDSLWSLAQRFGTTVDAIRTLNNLTSDALQIGQVLRIPTANSVSGPATIVLDPGHGGSDPGAVSGTRLEKNDNLNLALAVQQRLQALGQNVLMTRSTDIYVPLEERSAISNLNNADLFVSLHRNSSTNPNYNGVENFVYLNAPSTTTQYAQNVIDEVANAGVQNNRGVSRDDFSVLRNTDSPAMLLEMGFISNATDNTLFDQNFDAYADAITRGILISLGKPYTPVPAPSYFNYTVQNGDSLWAIAQRFGTTVDAIMALNGLTSSALSIGQVLRIPT